MGALDDILRFGNNHREGVMTPTEWTEEDEGIYTAEDFEEASFWETMEFWIGHLVVPVAEWVWDSLYLVRTCTQYTPRNRH